MTTDRLANWREIEAISQQLTELAHQELWEELPDLESKRRRMIEEFFNEPVADNIAAEISTGITKIQKSDEQILQLAQHGSKNITTHLAEIAKGKQVTEAYSNNS